MCYQYDQDNFTENMEAVLHNMKYYHFDSSLTKKLLDITHDDQYDLFIETLDHLSGEDMCVSSCSCGNDPDWRPCAICDKHMRGNDREYHVTGYHACIKYLGAKVCVCEDHVVDGPYGVSDLPEEIKVKIVEYLNSFSDYGSLLFNQIEKYLNKTLDEGQTAIVMSCLQTS